MRLLAPFSRTVRATGRSDGGTALPRALLINYTYISHTFHHNRNHQGSFTNIFDDFEL